MIGRDRRYGGSRQVSLKAKVGIATAVLVGGGAIGVAAATSSHSPSSAANAGYSRHFSQHHSHQLSQAQLLQLALSARTNTTAFTNLAQLTSIRSFSQMWMNHQLMAVQRGAVVLVAKNFIILQSANGSLHLWMTSGRTQFTNATTTTSTSALTANTFATQQAMVKNNMVPAAQTVAGVNLVNQLVAPAATTRTVTVAIAGTNVTVSVTVTQNTATVATTQGSFTTRTLQNLLLAQQNAMARNQIARGDIAVIAGVRTGAWLHAQRVVFAATTNAAGQTLPTTGTSTGTGTGTGTSTGTTTGGNSYNSVTGGSGTHS